VDCGLFQGGREAERKNLESLRFDLKSLDFVLITHAHLDHCGLLPRLVALGYRGPIYATTATCDLMTVMLKDSAHIQEKEAAWLNQKNNPANHRRLQGKHRAPRPSREAEPLYTVLQAEACMRQVRGVAYNTQIQPHPTVTFQLVDAGHILGSAIIRATVKERRKTTQLVFSGDLGQPARPLMQDPTPVHEADILLIESTYGNRLHKNFEQTLDELVAAVTATLKHGGNVIVPAFALGRTQELIALLQRLHFEGRLPKLKVYIDSPLAQRATEITLHHARLLDADAAWLTGTQPMKNAPAAKRGGIEVYFTESPEESMRLNAVRGGAVIIAGSGMCDGGRIKYHLRENLPRPECAVLITGFQAAGTLGRRIVDQARSVKIFGEDIAVRAQIYTLGGLSAHADRDALLGWLRGFHRPPRKVFVVHGESSTAQQFAATIKTELGWETILPSRNESVVV